MFLNQHNRTLAVVIAAIILLTLPFTASASGNNSSATATEFYDDVTVYETISSSSDVDWWKISFDYTGAANFYMSSIPSGCNYNMYVYKNDGTTLLASSAKSGNSAETVRCRVYKDTYYRVKIVSVEGFSTTDTYKFRAKVYPQAVAKLFTFNYTVNGEVVDSRPYASPSLSHIWNMGYEGTSFNNNYAATAYNAMPSCDIFVVTNHASAGRIRFNKTATDYSHIYAAYDDTSITTDRKISDYVSAQNLSDVELVLYACCQTGALHSTYGNLVDQTLAAGAKCCIGFTGEILKPHTHSWTISFFKYCRQGYIENYETEDIEIGYTIYHAIEGALQDVYQEYESYGGLDSVYTANTQTMSITLGGN